MIQWLDQSKNQERFLEAKALVEPIAIDIALVAIRDVLADRIVGEGNATSFDLLMLEVNCDTGRLIGAASTEQRWMDGQTDGCSVRVQELQDFWYDLEEAGVSGEEFEEQVRGRIFALGEAFMLLIEESLAVLRGKAAKAGFTLVVFGGIPGEKILERHYS